MTRFAFQRPRCRALFAVVLVLLSAPALAQESKGPLDFLKPWLKREILGKLHNKPAEPTGSVPEESAPPASPDSDRDSLTSVLRSALGAEEAGAPESANADPAAPGLAEPQTTASALGDMSGPDGMAGGDAESDAASIDAGAADEAEAVPEAPKPEPLRLAVLAGRSVAATMAAVAPLAQEMGGLIGRPVEILPLPSYPAMIDAQVDRRIDGAFYSGLAYALAEERCGCLEPLVAPQAFDGTLGYYAIVVARAGSGITKVSDLAGRTVAVASDDSIGARRMQLAGLAAEGVDSSSFGALREAGSAAEAVRLVADGSVDAAFAWSSLAGRVEEGYSRGTLASLVASGAIAMRDLTVIWRSPEIEHGPFALLRSLPAAEKNAIESYLVGLNVERPEAYDALNPFYGGGYAAVDARDYSGMAMLAAQESGASARPTETSE